MSSGINSRIREIRRRYCNDSNAEFADRMGEKPNTVNNWVRDGYSVGKIVINKIVKKFPEIDASWLLTGEGRMLKDDAAHLALPNIKYVPMVSQYAYIGYLTGYGDEEYIESLPTIPFIVDQQQMKEHYVCFEVKGDSMDDGTQDSILEGDRLLCREIGRHHWTQDKPHINRWDFVIVHRTEGILVKRIVKHDIEKCEITIHSLNPEYADRVLHFNDIAQIFNVAEVSRNRKR
ncbi:MAG: LexA family transcriptional regulator [Prevotellaceae bacterium]|jgi:SOS-response transcriptional repressor LexA|nr:LexA family transcriptional regulator [Prevotellaceae bacterium]